jgi:UDPglucose 6-dehydrogenase
MKIGIIGYGYVGKAIAWAYKNSDLVIRDPQLKNSADLDKFVDREAIFICVPSPSSEDGQCDTSILEEVLTELLFVSIKNPDCVFISKTTAPPSVYKKLQQQYPNLVHSPEFLTQANSIRDYGNARYCVLGGNYNWAVRARNIIYEGRKLSHDDHIIVNIETAALYKYMMNSYLAMKVTFMNEFKKIADASNVDIKDLVYLATYDNRIGTTHMKVPGPDGKYGWGGACFPKDIAAIIKEAENLKIEFELLKNIVSINTKHRQ